MLRWCAAITVLTVLVIANSSIGATSHHQTGKAVLLTWLCSVPQSLRTQPVPANGRLRKLVVTMRNPTSKAHKNGVHLHAWVEAPRTVSFAGYGVIAQISFTRRTGPVFVRLASARADCVWVRILLTWA